MSSAMNESAFAVDADNRLLWRMNPRRLDIESWRDTLLFVTGELDTKVGGPPVDSLLESRRRTLYGAISRNGDRFASDAFLRLFDFPLPRATSEGRRTSVIPQQALFLMNSPFMAERARAFAARLEAESSTEEERVKNACLLLFGRNPSAEEQELARVAVHSAQHGGSSWFLEVHDSEFESGPVAAVFTWLVICSLARAVPAARRSLRAGSNEEASASSPVGESN
jgi:hypothetical protein